MSKRRLDVDGNSSNSLTTAKRIKEELSNPSNLRGKINPFNGKLFSDKYFDILKKRIELPVWEYREKFMETMKEKQAFVLVGETGSGKTTQVHDRWYVVA